MLDRLISIQSISAMNAKALHQDVERRQALRVDLSFPAVVRGVDATGERFTAQTTLDNLSACGLHLRLQRLVEPGAILFVVVRLSADAERTIIAPSIALHGTIVRVEQQLNGCYGVALEFEHHRFLYARSMTNGC
jgi:hypothetical protein